MRLLKCLHHYEETTYENLAQHPQVPALIYQLLVPAMAAGLPDERSEAIYEEICRHYALPNGEAYEAWRAELIKILEQPCPRATSQKDLSERPLPASSAGSGRTSRLPASDGRTQRGGEGGRRYQRALQSGI